MPSGAGRRAKYGSSEGTIWATRPPVRFSATPARSDHRPAPRLGEHTAEILGAGDD